MLQQHPFLLHPFPDMEGDIAQLDKMVVICYDLVNLNDSVVPFEKRAPSPCQHDKSAPLNRMKVVAIATDLTET